MTTRSGQSGIALVIRWSSSIRYHLSEIVNRHAHSVLGRIWPTCPQLGRRAFCAPRRGGRALTYGHGLLKDAAVQMPLVVLCFMPKLCLGTAVFEDGDGMPVASAYPSSGCEHAWCHPASDR